MKALKPRNMDKVRIMVKENNEQARYIDLFMTNRDEVCRVLGEAIESETGEAVAWKERKPRTPAEDAVDEA